MILYVEMLSYLGSRIRCQADREGTVSAPGDADREVRSQRSLHLECSAVVDEAKEEKPFRAIQGPLQTHCPPPSSSKRAGSQAFLGVGPSCSLTPTITCCALAPDQRGLS